MITTKICRCKFSLQRLHLLGVVLTYWRTKDIEQLFMKEFNSSSEEECEIGPVRDNLGIVGYDNDSFTVVSINPKLNSTPMALSVNRLKSKSL